MLIAGVVFNLCDQRPISLTLVHLLAGTPMDAQCFDTHILQTFGHFYYVFGICHPSRGGSLRSLVG